MEILSICGLKVFKSVDFSFFPDYDNDSQIQEKIKLV